MPSAPPLSLPSNRACSRAQAFEALVQEVTALRQAYSVSDKFVPRLHEVVETEETLYLVLDQVRGVELFELLVDTPISEPVGARLIRQLLAALSSLHEHCVVHRDVKPENLMVCEPNDPHNCTLKLIDFGYAAVGTSAEVAGGLTELAGSPEYAAPEVLSWLDGQGTPYSSACDMWSVGATVYVMLCGEMPFEMPEAGSLEEHVRGTPLEFAHPVWESHGMGAAVEFVRECMRLEPEERLTAKRAQQHGWLSAGADGKGVGAPARLQRRVRSSHARSHVTRWFGRLAGRVPPSPMKQEFWGRSLGMPQAIAASPQVASPEPTEAAPPSGERPSGDADGAHAAAGSGAGAPPFEVEVSEGLQLALDSYRESRRWGGQIRLDQAEELYIKQSSARAAATSDAVTAGVRRVQASFRRLQENLDEEEMIKGAAAARASSPRRWDELEV